jgi:hypothetical protein|tara:strand:+ start:903 stop:1418 length:516 start_codon:yes stop_codon:yes gene_type:complete
MINDNKTPEINAPIPGMSLTAPLGGRPWQQPPQMATVEQAIDYYVPKIMDKEFIPELLTIIELGIPLTTIANSFQLASVMEGKHSIDVGVLVIPVLVELMMTVADANEVEYVSGMSREKEKGLSNAQIALAKKKGLLDKDIKVEEPTPEPTEEPEEEEPSMGLMSRRENVQ